MTRPEFGDPVWIARAAKKSYRGTPWAERCGFGPAGKTCRECEYLTKRGGCSKSFYKCGARKITRGPGTDIRRKDPACILFRRASSLDEGGKMDDQARREGR